MHIIPLTILHLQEEGYHLITKVKIFDQYFDMVIDTGASKTVLDRTTLLGSGIAESHLTDTDILSTGLGTNSMSSQFIELPTLSMGDWKQKNIQVAVLDLSTINFAYEKMGLPKVLGVIGGDILCNYGAVINYKNKSLKLNARKRKMSEQQR